MLMFYLQPVSVVVPLGFAAGGGVFRPELFRREYRKFCAVGAGVLVLLAPLLYQGVRGGMFGAGAARVPLFSALGGVARCWQNLTAFGFTDRFTPEIGLGIPGLLVMFSIPVIVFFLILGVIAVIRRWRRHELNTFDRLCVCGGITIVLFAAGLLILRVEPQAHYNSVVAFAWLLLAWRGFTVLRGDYRKTAAILLGASGWQMFRRVTLPNIRWALLYGVVLTNARAIGEFGAVSVVSGSIRGETLSLPLQIELLEQDYNTVGSFTAAALLTLMAILTLFLKSVVQWRLENQEKRQHQEGNHEH